MENTSKKHRVVIFYTNGKQTHFWGPAHETLSKLRNEAEFSMEMNKNENPGNTFTYQLKSFKNYEKCVEFIRTIESNSFAF